MTQDIKDRYIEIIKYQLSQFIEVNKIIIFGSFFKSKNPNDIDIAIIQDSDSNFLTLSLKYRKVLRELAKKIPLDIVPMKKNTDSYFIDELTNGKVIYEK